MRPKIGFKLPKEEQLVIVDNQPLSVAHPLHPKAEAILKLAAEIDKLMKQQSELPSYSMSFSQHKGKELIHKLDKIYTKYYEAV